MVNLMERRMVGAALDLARNEVVARTATGFRAHTKPNVDLYPFLWDWDSAIVAMAFSDLGIPERGLAELRSLHAAQHESGLVAHIAFSRAESDLARYFPGPDVWGGLHGRDGRPISGITQPPVSGIALRSLVEHGIDPESPGVRDLAIRIDEHHRWWMRERDPAGDGNVVVLHGWSTGRDNAPEVLDLYRGNDIPVRRGVGALRRDLAHGVSADSRPTDEYYERSIGLADRGVELGGWTSPGLAARMPMQLSDPLVAALLAGSAADLAFVARVAGLPRIADSSAHIAQRVTGALAARATSDGAIHAVDVRRGRLLDQHKTITTPMTAWAPGLPDSVLAHNAQLIHDGDLGGAHGVLTTARDSAWFDPQRYWQGPSWPHMDELVARGLQRSASEPGRSPEVRRTVHDAITELDARTSAAILRDGSPEYRHADTGVTVGKQHMSFSSGSQIMHARRGGHHDEALRRAADAYREASVWHAAP